MRIPLDHVDDHLERWAELLEQPCLYDRRLGASEILDWEYAAVPTAIDDTFLSRVTRDLEAAAVAPMQFAANRVEYLRGVAALAPYLFSWVQEPERMETCFTFVYWAFLTDDEIDCLTLPAESSEAAIARVAASREELKGALTERPSFSHGGGSRQQLVRYTRYLRKLLARHAPSEAWFARCVADLSDYLDGTSTAFRWWQRRQVPTIAQYLVHRLHDVGAYPTADLVELGLGFALDDALLRFPPVRQLRLCCLLHATFTNDLYSHKRERDEQHSTWNIIEVLRHQLDLDDAEAINRVVRLMNEMGDAMRDCMSVLTGLDMHDRTRLRRYFTAMASLPMGWVSYVRDSERFRGYADPCMAHTPVS